MITLIVAALSGGTMAITGITCIVKARRPAGPQDPAECLANGEVAS